MRFQLNVPRIYLCGSRSSLPQMYAAIAATSKTIVKHSASLVAVFNVRSLGTNTVLWTRQERFLEKSSIVRVIGFLRDLSCCWL